MQCPSILSEFLLSYERKTEDREYFWIDPVEHDICWFSLVPITTAPPTNACFANAPTIAPYMRLEPATIPTAIKQIVTAIFIDPFFELVSIVNCSFMWKYLKIVTRIGNTYINYSGECFNEKK